MNSIQKSAKIAGVFYLVFIVFSVLADQFASFAQGTSVQILERIALSQELFTLGLVFNILSGLFFLLTAWALFVLLKDINKNIAGLFLLLNLAGVVVQCISVTFLFACKELLSDSLFVNSINSVGLDSLSHLFINLYQNGFIIAQVFFGLWLLPLGYLIYKSKFLPKFLGIIIIVDCGAVLLWFFQYFLFPQAVIITNICLLISLIAEFGLTFWLLIKGAKTIE